MLVIPTCIQKGMYTILWSFVHVSVLWCDHNAQICHRGSFGLFEEATSILPIGLDFPQINLKQHHSGSSLSKILILQKKNQEYIHHPFAWFGAPFCYIIFLNSGKHAYHNPVLLVSKWQVVGSFYYGTVELNGTDWQEATSPVFTWYGFNWWEIPWWFPHPHTGIHT